MRAFHFGLLVLHHLIMPYPRFFKLGAGFFEVKAFRTR
jgi:hypothetical protein